MTRFNTFTENYLKTKAHRHGSYRMGVNQFSDMGFGEWIEIYGKGLKEDKAGPKRLGWGNSQE